MASKIGLSYRLDAAEQRLKHEAERLRSRGVDIGSRPDPHRQPEVNSVNLVEWAAAVLEATNERIDELLADDRTREPSDDPQYDRMRVDELRALLEDRDIAIPDRAKKADLVALLEGADHPEPPTLEPVEEPDGTGEAPVDPEALGTVADVSPPVGDVPLPVMETEQP